MIDLPQVLPHFNVKAFSHIIPSLDKNLITTHDVLTLEPLDVAKRALVPPGEVKKLADALIVALNGQTLVQWAHGERQGADEKEIKERAGKQHDDSPMWKSISTLDAQLDAMLGGGFPTKYITEITGERYDSLLC
jgi:DNA repair protein RAD57